jgi:hypothetical protein
MPQQATFFIGHNVAGVPTHSHHDIILKAMDLFQAFTAYEAAGYWQGQREASTVLIVAGIEPEAATDAKKVLAAAFRQDEVLCTLAPLVFA